MLNLIDVLAIGPRPASPVEMTLSPLWSYRWSSLYTAIDRASQELAETIADDDWLRQLRDERLAWLDSQKTTAINPETGRQLSSQTNFVQTRVDSESAFRTYASTG